MTSTMSLAQLEQVVSTFYGGSQDQMAAADAALAAVREHWWAAGPWRLLEALANAGTPTLLWSCSLVEQWLRRRWRRIPEAERAACRLAVVQLVIAAAQSRAGGTSTRPTAAEGKLISSKLESLLAALLRADWPAGWPSFLPDLLQAPQLDDSARLRISLLLAEEAVASRGGGGADGGGESSSHRAAVRALLEANGGQQAAQLLSLCHRALVSSAQQVGGRAPAGERVQPGLNVAGRFAPCLPLPLLLTPELLGPLPRLLERFRGSVLKLLADLSRAEPQPAGTPPGQLQPADADAVARLHATMRDVFGQVAGRLPPLLAQACGHASGGDAPWSWNEVLVQTKRYICTCRSIDIQIRIDIDRRPVELE